MEGRKDRGGWGGGGCKVGERKTYSSIHKLS